MAEGARLESVCRGNPTVGSNPTLSAIVSHALFEGRAGAESRRELRSLKSGEVPEWSIGLVSKTSDRSRDPWVRIPPSPPVVQDRAAVGGVAAKGLELADPGRSIG